MRFLNAAGARPALLILLLLGVVTTPAVLSGLAPAALADEMPAERPAAASDEPAGETGAYILGSGDVVAISVWAGTGEKPEQTQATVSGTGTIDVVYLGPVEVGGSTTSEARDSITRGLIEAGIFRQPHVAVNVIEHRSHPVNVTGYVEAPGRYYLRGPTRLLDILSEAGGVKEQDAAATVHVIREGRAEPIVVRRVDLYGADPDSRAAANLRLRGGDTVHVPRQARFCILGPVDKPDCYEFQHGLTLDEAISRAGGLDPERGDPRAITVQRQDASGSIAAFDLDLTDPTRSGARFLIEQGDQIVVGETSFYVSVDGTVAEPGTVPWVPGLTLTDALAAAKGTATQHANGNLKKVRLRRGGETREVNVKRIYEGDAPDVPLEPADRIFVPKAFW